jgi:pimeloyl-ACP methyl ester carboxylesterase
MHTRTTIARLVAAVSLIAIAALIAVPVADASSYAALDQPGPPLSPSPAALAASLTCSPDVGHSNKEPVLLVPGTWGTFQNYWSWNLAPELSSLGIPWCGVTPPYHQLGDTQIAGEYDAYAIRYLYHHSGNRKIAIFGHSQGGMQPRWALRFWPDTRNMVADDIGIAPDNQGATLERQICTVTQTVKTCPLNFWQGAPGSNFIQALNSRAQMFPGIDYTVIYSTNDLLVQPKDTPLSGAGSYRRIALQELCPGHLSTHLQQPFDPIMWELTLDAITHPGPADPARIPPSVCSQATMPGVTLATAAVKGSEFLADAAAATAAAPMSSQEPQLACYVTASCTGPQAPSLLIWRITKPRALHAHHRTIIHILIRVDEGAVLVPVPGAAITIGPYRRTTDSDGDTTVVANFNRPGTKTLTATKAGCNPAEVRITVRR